MERMERENAEVSGDEEEELAEEANPDEPNIDVSQKKAADNEDVDGDDEY
jgi:hypothetical protein